MRTVLVSSEGAREKRKITEGKLEALLDFGILFNGKESVSPASLGIYCYLSQARNIQTPKGKTVIFGGHFGDTLKTQKTRYSTCAEISGF